MPEVDFTLEALKEVREAGCTRAGVTATAAILDAWKDELERQKRAGGSVLS